MRHRFIAGFLFLSSCALIGIGYLLLNPELIVQCPSDPYSNCNSQFWSLGIGSPLYWGIAYLPPLFLALVFVRKEVFAAWWRIILPFAVVALLIISATTELGTLLTPDRTLTTKYMSLLIVGVSALVVAWKYWRLSKTNQ